MHNVKCKCNVLQRGSVCGSPHGGACAQASNPPEESTPYRLDDTSGKIFEGNLNAYV